MASQTVSRKTISVTHSEKRRIAWSVFAEARHKSSAPTAGRKMIRLSSQVNRLADREIELQQPSVVQLVET